MFSTAYKSDAPWNETAWKNDRFDELLLKARAELDEEKRQPDVREMQQIVHDDGGELMPDVRGLCRCAVQQDRP